MSLLTYDVSCKPFYDLMKLVFELKDKTPGWALSLVNMHMHIYIFKKVLRYVDECSSERKYVFY
jgi:hypothetical protein